MSNNQKDKSLVGLSGSLATRVLAVALMLLVIPLFVHSVITFTRDYRVEFNDLFLSIKILGAARAHLVDQFNHLEYRFLDLTEELIELKEDIPKTTPNQLNAFLARIKEEQNVSGIFMLTKQDGEWICTASSNPYMIGKNYSKGVDEFTLSREHTATIRWDEHTHQGYYAVTKRIYSPGSAEISGMLTIAISSKLMLERLSVVNRKGDPTQYSLIDKNGVVFLSTDQDLVFSQIILEGKPKSTSEKPKQVIVLEPYHVDVKGAQNNYRFDVNGQKQYGVLETIQASELSLLISIPALTIFDHFRVYLYELGVFLLIFLVVGGVGTWWLTYRMARPFRSLCQTMIKVEEGDLQARFEEQKMGFEINIVGRIFNEMISSLLDHMRVAENERVAKETLARELLIGQTVQKSILPKQVPAFSDFQLATGFISAKEVGGDFYDLFIACPNSHNHLLCAIADTAGKGISACFYSLGLRSILRSYALTTSDLAKLLMLTNNAFCHDTGDSGVFVTTWVAMIDESTKVMRYSSCGHPPALLKRNGQIEKLTTPGIALGAGHLEHVDTHEIQLQSNDLLLLYTDGIIEAHNAQKELYGEARLMAFLKNHPGQSAQSVVDDLLIDVGRFTTGVAQFDDQTILVMRVL